MAESNSSWSKHDGFTELNKEQRDVIIAKKNAKNTHRSTNTWVTRLNKFGQKIGMGDFLEEVADSDLADLIEEFYAAIKKNPKGNYCDSYKNLSLKVMRAGINRHLKEKRSIDMLNDPIFLHCNSLLQGLLKEGKAKGLGKVDHKPLITSEDLEKLNDYFSTYMKPSAVVLQRYMQFSLMFFLCRRGRENLTFMDTETFSVHRSTTKQIQVLPKFYRPGLLSLNHTFL